MRLGIRRYVYHLDSQTYRCQYLYFYTSKAIKARVSGLGGMYITLTVRLMATVAPFITACRPLAACQAAR
jgi:hypothetical protein